MILSFFHTILYVPIYNLLVFLVGVLPHGDLGLAVVIVTLIVKLVIMPLSFSALRTQRAMKTIEPELKELQEKYKDDPEKKAKETFALYKRYGINPFASILTLLIQLPIIFSLYFVFRSKSLLVINTSLLYPFVHVPTTVSHLFLGVFTIAASSLVLAAVAAVLQYVQAVYTIPAAPPAVKGAVPSMQTDLARAMSLQMRYILPVFIGFIAYTSGAIALYFITSSVVAVIQEFLIRRHPVAPLPAKTAPV